MFKLTDIHPGHKIRSWDFQPSSDRTDRYVEGVVKSITDGEIRITVEKDTAFKPGDRTEISTPMHLWILEWNGRLELMSYDRLGQERAYVAVKTDREEA